MNEGMDLARGYIASGEFIGHRVPQHIQNQIVKSYCDSNALTYVLSRAEYWINGSTDCQLWAALKEGFNHIVFYSIWQLPENAIVRKEVYKFCLDHQIILHFAVERMSSEVGQEAFAEFELLLKSNILILREISNSDHLSNVRKFM